MSRSRYHRLIAGQNVTSRRGVIGIVLFGFLAVAFFVIAATMNQAAVGLVGLFFFGILAAVAAIRHENEKRRRLDLPKIRAAQRKKVSTVVKDLAKHFKCDPIYDETGLPSFMTTRGGQAVEISGAANNLIMVSSMPVGDYRLFIYPTRQMRKSGFRNIVDFPLGDRAFDRDFVLQTNDGSRTRNIVSMPTRELLTELADSVKPLPVSVTLNGGEMKLFAPLPEDERHFHIADKCLELLEVFQKQLGIWSDSNVLDFVPSKAPSEAPVCLVCGDMIVQQLVKCTRCRTSHHLECWKYIGHCSVFGCGATRFDHSIK